MHQCYLQSMTLTVNHTIVIHSRDHEGFGYPGGKCHPKLKSASFSFTAAW